MLYIDLQKITIRNIEGSSSSKEFLTYCSVQTQFGDVVLAEQNMKICFCSFWGKGRALEDLRHEWGENLLFSESRILELLSKKQLDLVVRGSMFRITVLQALCRLPHGYTFSYEEIAKMIDRPKATRAVSTAIANNSIALLIPCHRVIRKNGDLGGYRWSRELKEIIIKSEE